MSPKQWGPPTWTFFHTIIEKINEDSYNVISNQLFFYLFRICCYLPCPDCSKHARQFLSKVNPSGLKTKNDFKNLFYIFHNVVNKRKNKQLFNFDYLDNYKKFNLINTYKNFIIVYNTKGNMQLLAETFQRKLIMNDFKKWFFDNLIHFSP